MDKWEKLKNYLQDCINQEDADRNTYLEIFEEMEKIEMEVI